MQYLRRASGDSGRRFAEILTDAAYEDRRS
jgi:hypothetical protein